MPVLRAVFSLVRIAALCVMVGNLHDVAMAGYHITYQDCPSVTEPDQSSPKSSHPGTCCTSIQCCLVLAEPPCEASHPTASRTAPPLRSEPSPLLLVRAIHPPPKQHFS